MEKAIMNKEEVIKRFCAMSTKVMKEVYNYKYAADCFCADDLTPDEYFIFSLKVMKFIERSIDRAISEEQMNNLLNDY